MKQAFLFAAAAAHLATSVDGLILGTLRPNNVTGSPLPRSGAAAASEEKQLQNVSSVNASLSSHDGAGAKKAATAGLLEVEKEGDDKQVPTVRHKKEAGNGYLEGSPLFEHQQALRRQEVTTTTPAPAVPDPAAMSPVKPPSAEQGIGGSIVYVLFVFLVAYLYRQHQAKDQTIHTEVAPYQGDGFTHGFCDLCHKDDGRILCWALCCPGIRWADTVSNIKVRFMTFWAALAVFLALSVLASGLQLYEIGGLFGMALLIMGVYYRQRLRGVFGHSKGTVKSIALDVMAWACCPCCAIVQEAKEVEYCFIK